jgi:altronate hydrolase
MNVISKPPTGQPAGPPRVLRLNAADNVVVAVDPVDPGVVAAGAPAQARIPRGHKMAVLPIARGEPIRKYGQVIGYAAEAIEPGQHVHSHNCLFAAVALDYAHASAAPPTDFVAPEARATFEGFRRDNGRFGTRNYVGILTSVNCSASVAKFIAEEVREDMRAMDHGRSVAPSGDSLNRQSLDMERR